MKDLKALISGSFLPTIIFPFLITLALLFLDRGITRVVFIYYIPIIWGIWNVLYFRWFQHFLPGDENVKLWITGILLGIILSLYGIFVSELPKFLYLSGFWYYLPLVLVPILYGVLWRFIVKPLNKIVHVESKMGIFNM